MQLSVFAMSAGLRKKTIAVGRFKRLQNTHFLKRNKVVRVLSRYDWRWMFDEEISPKSGNNEIVVVMIGSLIPKIIFPPSFLFLCHDVQCFVHKTEMLDRSFMDNYMKDASTNNIFKIKVINRPSISNCWIYAAKSTNKQSKANWKGMNHSSDIYSMTNK